MEKVGCRFGTGGGGGSMSNQPWMDSAVKRALPEGRDFPPPSPLSLTVGLDEKGLFCSLGTEHGAPL